MYVTSYILHINTNQHIDTHSGDRHLRDRSQLDTYTIYTLLHLFPPTTSEGPRGKEKINKKITQPIMPPTSKPPISSPSADIKYKPCPCILIRVEQHITICYTDIAIGSFIYKLIGTLHIVHVLLLRPTINYNYCCNVLPYSG